MTAVESGEFNGRQAVQRKGAEQFCSGATRIGEGPTIIYMPTRKETETLAKFLCKQGVSAAAYHAKV
jgi:Werner syndrome ATP-dependent helicase